VDEAKDVQLVHAIRLQKTSGCKKTSPFIDSSYKISMGFEKKKKKKHFASNIYLYYFYLEGS